MTWRRSALSGLFVLLVAAVLLLLASHFGNAATVVATAETHPVPSAGDAADDPVIWRDPGAPARSIIIGTDKRKGLAVYDLNGRQLQFLPDGLINNVDLRDGFPLAGRPVTLVTASNQSDSSIGMYLLDPESRALMPIAARRVITTEPYGACMYHSPLSGRFYYFVNSKGGTVEQWELHATAAGRVDATRVRAFTVGDQPEGCVADDELRFFYLGVEDQGIWKYGAEPGDGSDHRVVDTTDWKGRLHSDVEGLTMYYGSNGAGYLIASSQGSDEFVIYDRHGRNRYIGKFRIVAGERIDGVTSTDGIDVIGRALGPAFAKGLFVAQDDSNDSGHQNFKLVAWESIASSLGIE